MKNILSATKTVVILLIITVISLGFYAYMLIRPISYGMGYHHESVYEGEVFKGTLTLYPNGIMTNKGTNFDEEIEYYYYYKNGYAFSLMAQTEQEYDEEIKYINENFEDAVNSPFYASEISAFRHVSVGVDGYTVIYICTGAIIFAIAFGIVELALIGLTCVSFLLRKKQNNIT